MAIDPSRIIGVTAALSGALGVLMLSMGAHGASDDIAAGRLNTGGLILVLHAMAALIALSRHAKLAAGLFLIGGVLFASAMALFVFAPGLYVIGLAPAGGIALLIGWLALAVTELRRTA